MLFYGSITNKQLSIGVFLRLVPHPMCSSATNHRHKIQRNQIDNNYYFSRNNNGFMFARSNFDDLTSIDVVNDRSTVNLMHTFISLEKLQLNVSSSHAT